MTIKIKYVIITLTIKNLKGEKMRIIRCSSLPRFFLCPASTSEHINIESNNAYSTAGTELHEHIKDYIQRRTKGDFGFQFWRAVDFLKQYEHAKIEAEIKMSAEYEGFVWQGTADCIIKTDTETVIIDWKTYRAELADYFPQLAGYAALYHHYTSTENIYVGLANLTDNIIEIKKISVKEMQYVLNTVVGNMSKADRYNPSSFACSYCNHRASCAAIKQIMIEVANNSEITPQNIAENWEKIQLIEKIIEGAKEKFKLFVELSGKYETPTGVFEIKEEERSKYDVEKAFRILSAQYGLDVALKAFNVNATGLKELARQIPSKKLKDAINEVNALVEQSGAVSKTTVKKLTFKRKEEKNV